MATTATTIIVKITNGTEIRRLTAQANTLTWASLAKQSAGLFDLPRKELKFTYVDDEGDRITISSDDELHEAAGLALKTSPAVLRLTIVVADPKPATTTSTTTTDVPMSDAGTTAKPTTTDTAAGGGVPPGGVPPGGADELNAFFQNLAHQMPALVQQLPPGVRNLIPHAELDVAATIAANAAANASCAAAQQASACATAFAQAAAAHAAANASPEAAADSATGIHPGVTCDRSGLCPIVGNRFHLVGHNYDICQAEFDKLDDKEKALYQRIPPPFVHVMPPEGATADADAATGVHPGVACDRSGECPIVGNRYNLRGHNYDLCQAEYDKLPAQEKLLYATVPPPMPAHAAAAAMATAAAGWHGGPWRPSGQWGGRGRWGCRGMNSHGGMNHVGPMRPEGCGGKLAARFVRDISIFDGTQMSPATAFTKIWRLKNTGEVAWPPGTRMLFVGGDQMTTEMSVPLSRTTAVQPGEEVDVAVEMAAPHELGRYLGYWRLVGPHGRRKFGQRVWCHVQVVDPNANPASVTTDDELSLALAEIEKKKSDLGMHDEANDDEEMDPKVDGAAGGAGPASKPSKPSFDACSLVPPGEAEKSTNLTTSGLTSDSAPMSSTLSEATAAGLSGLAALGAEVVPTTLVPDEPDRASDKSDEPVVVTEAMAREAGPTAAEGSTESAKSPADVTDAGDDPFPSGVEQVVAALASMGFVDMSMVDIVIEKNGADLEACARDLASASEWDALLDDLAEMGFANRELNKSLMFKHGGNVKRTVRELVDDA